MSPFATWMCTYSKWQDDIIEHGVEFHHCSHLWWDLIVFILLYLLFSPINESVCCDLHVPREARAPVWTGYILPLAPALFLCNCKWQCSLHECFVDGRRSRGKYRDIEMHLVLSVFVILSFSFSQVWKLYSPFKKTKNKKKPHSNLFSFWPYCLSIHMDLGMAINHIYLDIFLWHHS